MSGSSVFLGVYDAPPAAPASGDAIPVAVDSDGSVIVTIGGTGSLAVRGAVTPADSYVNPTDAVDTFALGASWNPTTSRWNRNVGQFANDLILPTNALNTNAFLMGLNEAAGGWQRARMKGWGATPGADVLSSTAGNLATIGQIVGPDGAGGYRVARVTSAGGLAVAGVVTDGPAGYSLGAYNVPCLTTRGGLLTTYRRPPTASGNDQWSLARAQNVNAASMIGAACVMFSARISNDTGASVRVAFVNKASAPVNTDTIALGPYIVPNGETLSLSDRELGPAGFYFSAGAGMAVVTTVGAATVALAGAPTGLLVEIQGNA